LIIRNDNDRLELLQGTLEVLILRSLKLEPNQLMESRNFCNNNPTVSFSSTTAPFTLHSNVFFSANGFPHSGRLRPAESAPGITA
jgi:hypothetical protein